MGQSRAPQKKSFWSKFHRGATFTGVGMVIIGGVSLFLPFVPLVVAVAVGGVAGGAIANATGEEVK